MELLPDSFYHLHHLLHGRTEFTFIVFYRSGGLQHTWGGVELTGPRAKGDQSWVFIGRTDAKAETPILWTPDVKS